MKPTVMFRHEFVEYLPAQIEQGIIYVSMPFATAAHKCACGCGNDVITPITPTDWQLTYDGDSISLHPSIGNWNFPCQSHYWLRHNYIHWAPKWSRQEIDAGRAHDRKTKEQYFDASRQGAPASKKAKKSWWHPLKERFF
jgi:hypothetical protein